MMNIFSGAAIKDFQALEKTSVSPEKHPALKNNNNPFFVQHFLLEPGSIELIEIHIQPASGSGSRFTTLIPKGIFSRLHCTVKRMPRFKFPAIRNAAGPEKNKSVQLRFLKNLKSQVPPLSEREIAPPPPYCSHPLLYLYVL